MRIGIDCRLPYYSVGGISQYVVQLTSALARIDKENEYLLLTSRKDQRSYRAEKARNFSRANVWTPAHHRLEQWSLSLEVRRFNLDLLHSPDFIPPKFGAGVRVITIHDLNFVHFPEYLTKESLRYYRDQIRWAAEEATRIAVDSKSTREDVINLLDVDPGKVAAIPLAAAPIFTRVQPRSDVIDTLTGLDLTEGYVLFVGTLSPRKNLNTLIRAYARLRADVGVRAQLVIVGRKGWAYESFFEEVRLSGLTDSVRHFDTLSDEQLPHLYSAAGVTVLPSLYEGFGFPILEAMQCGCPVIASNTSSLPEVAGPAAILLEPEDVGGWANALQKVLSNDALRQEMIALGFEQASLFSWDKCARDTVALYQDAFDSQYS